MLDKIWSNSDIERYKNRAIKFAKEHKEFCDMIDEYIQSNDFGQNECDDILYIIKGAHKIGKYAIAIKDNMLHSDTHSVFIDLCFDIKIEDNITTITFRK